MIQSSSIVIDQIIYIIYHQKYQKAVKALLHVLTCGKFPFLDTAGLPSTSTVKRPTVKRTHKVNGTMKKASPNPEPEVECCPM